MAKRKTTHQAEEPKQTSSRPSAAMDDASEKFQSLKSLNDRLVKETMKQRKENMKLVGELTQVNECVFGLELERSVVSVFVTTHMDEIGSQFSGLMRERGESERVKSEREAEIGFLKDEMKLLICERDGIRNAFNVLMEEASELRGKMAAMEKNEEMALDEVGKLMAAKGILLKEKKKMLDDSVAETEDFKTQIDQIRNEKFEIEKEKNGLVMKMEKLERERNMKVDILVSELQNKEEDIKILTQQKDSLEKNLISVHEDYKRERINMEDAKAEAERVIYELQKESSKLKNSITASMESGKVEKERNEKLLSEVCHFRDALENIEFERDEARKKLSDEEKRAENLCLLVADKEKRIEEAMDELGNLKIAQENLMKERERMEKNLVEADSKIDDLRAEVELGSTNSEKALALLKNTAMEVCENHENGEMGSFEHKFGEEIKPFAEQLEAIRAAVVKKEKMVEEMRKLQISQEKKREKRGIFTMVTAATTILAAVSAVYVSKGR